MLFKTVPVNEKALVTFQDGTNKIVTGPALVFKPLRNIQILRKYLADQNQYLRVQYIDGRTEHIPGPHCLYLDPTQHKAADVVPGIYLDGNDSLVVYKRDYSASSSVSFTTPVPGSTPTGDLEDEIKLNNNNNNNNNSNKNVIRRIVRGPVLFMPEASEWLHQFSWHGVASASSEDKAHLVPNANQFTKLRSCPDQFYYNINSVRTSDDALLRVKIMVFYELVDIELMLSQTHDPIADMSNAAIADVVAFTSVLTYEQFQERTSDLNDLANYPQLVAAATDDDDAGPDEPK